MNELTTFSGIPAAALAIFLTDRFKPLIPDDRYVPVVALAIGWLLGTLFAFASGNATGVTVSVLGAVLHGLLAGAAAVGFHSTATSVRDQPAAASTTAREG